MKYIYVILSFLVLSALTYTSCTPEEFDMETIDVKSDDLVEGIAYKIEHDAENPNIVYLTSLMDAKYQPLWNHPQGRSQEQKVTLKMPFAGEYEVQFGVQTRGGYVYGEKTTFGVADIYAPFIEDELWTLISGGIGKSKTWYLDLDSEETSRFFAGPMWFFTGTYEWDNLHTPSGDNYIDADVWDAKKAITPNLNEDGTEAAWYWKADWKGNQWMCAASDFGSMTFDLIDGANVVVDQSGYSSSIAGGNVQEGKYMLDADNHTIKFTDVYPLHAIERTEEVTAATEFRILYADSAKMQIMVFPSGTCFNYISKEYRDNWTPGEVVEPEPTLPDGWADDVSVTKSSTIKWVLSPETPFNWANLDGSLKYAGWVSPDTYDDWTDFDATTPATYQGFSLSMNSETMEVEYVAPDGATENGTYTLDEKGIYTFNGVTPNFTIGSWVPFKTSEAHNITVGDEPVNTEANTFRITKIEKDLSGSVTGMWVGVRAVDTEKGEYKNEYMVYKLIPQIGGGANDPAQAIKNIICGSTWKVDSDRSYDKTTSWGAEQGPVIFSDFSTWAWNPIPGQHYASGEDAVDYGTMKFELDGTVSVKQRRRIYTYVDETSGETVVRNSSPEEGDVLDTDDEVVLNGTWSLDLENNKLIMSVGAVHPWTCDYMVLDWGDLTIYRIENGAMLLQALRDAERSGEGADPMTYVFVPAQ